MAEALRLAVSNIAWERDDDDRVAELLRREKVEAIEIAPTKWRERPLDATPAEIIAFRREWADRGLRIVSMQALLFGRADLQLFGETRRAMSDYLRRMIDFGGAVGAHALVFGSPKNRTRGSLSTSDATQIAADFFRPLGAHAAELGVTLCIEANPPEYGCDFLTTTAEAVALCDVIDSPGIAINGDLGGMTMSGDDPRATIASAARWLGHFHASEPQLAEIGTTADHASAAAGLADIGYGRWVSIEMRGGGVSAVERAVSYVKRAYGR